MTDLFAKKDASPAANDAQRPLADRMRPNLIEDIAGQGHLTAPDAPLGRVLTGGGRLPSLILWGPPGCGKTTMARILAGHTDLHFEQISAIFSGVADLRKIFESA